MKKSFFFRTPNNVLAKISKFTYSTITIFLSAKWIIRVRKKNMASYTMTKFNMLNFRKQSAAKFTSQQKMNQTTGKQETMFDIQNDAGYGYKVVTPPCNALFPHLKEGGNEGGKFSKTPQTSSIISQLVLDGEDQHFHAERVDFFNWLRTTTDSCLDQMYDADPQGASTAIRKKTQKRYGKKKTPEECEEMSRKAFKKAAMVPIKDKEGETTIVVKCRAYTRDLTARTVRYVQESGNKFVEMEELPTIRNGALISLPFQLRPYVMAKDKYGITFTLIPDIVVFSTGKGRSSAPMEVIESPERPYQLSVAEGKEGKIYLNINDAENRRYMFRGPSTEVVFSDLDGMGTLGKIGGVTEANAKYCATCKEDPSDANSTAFYNYVQKLSDDVVDFCLENGTLLSKLKADSRDEAQEMADDGVGSFESCLKTVVKDSFNSPINKRDDDNYRQFKFSQRVFGYGDSPTQNKIPLTDSSGNPTDVEIRRGAKIAPVLIPSVYFMADGKFGLKFDISLDHGIRVDSNPEAASDEGGLIYSLKRAREDAEDTSSKRIRTDEVA